MFYYLRMQLVIRKYLLDFVVSYVVSVVSVMLHQRSDIDAKYVLSMRVFSN